MSLASVGVADDPTYEPIAPILKLARDVRSAGGLIGRDQARFIVDTYYEMQEHRIALDGQVRSLTETEQPATVVSHFAAQMGTLERQMVSVLDVFSDASEVGRWSRAQRGIGPVLAAGLLAHIDITRAPTVGHIWRFAGLDPTVRWEKKTRRPWNARLKVLCWKIGDSFVKVSNHEEGYYGHVYRQRKAQEVERNDAGVFADQAAASLTERQIKDAKLRTTYEAGRLPDGRIDLRARRYAVKLFLAHWQRVAYVTEYHVEPPKPYVIEHLGHAHLIDPPHWEPPGPSAPR